MSQIPQTMRAVVLTGHGNIDQLVYQTDCPVPTPRDHEVLLEIHACGLNNTDVNSRTGWYSKTVEDATTGSNFVSAETNDASWGGKPFSFPRIQGADVAATVYCAGNQVPSGLVGKRVMVDPWLRNWDISDDLGSWGFFGSECDGGFAEFAVVDYRQVHELNSEMSNAEIATFACSYITAENMLNKAQVKAGDSVLVTGATGGVGSALIQLAKRRDAITIAMASISKHSALKSAIAPDAVINRETENLKSELLATINMESVTVVADVVGGGKWPQLIEVLAPRGRYACSGAIAGPIVKFDLRTMYLNDLNFFGCTVVPRGIFSNLVKYIERGEIKPLVAGSYPLEELHIAQQKFIEKNHIGNFVVTT